ncbi:MAG: zinc ABC transporter substrate-binding protein [Clostridia bacterium]|nr:zinc ABC transporter substrate-binding protein [Clostridia bacterium]
MRRNVAIFTLFFLIVAALSGCQRLVEPEAASISVYATFWPIYALTDAVMQDVPDADLRLLVQPQDGCLRDYQLSDWDAALLSAGADAVIMGGRGLESFESLLFAWGESGPAVSAVLYNLELYNQDARADGESDSHLAGANPHLYMSIDGARRIVESISATLQSLDPKYAGRYVESAKGADEALERLLARNRAALSEYEGRSVVLMNEALIYAALDYDLEVADWIDRESGDPLAGNDLALCLERLDASGAQVILIEKQAPQALTEALEAAGYSVAKLDVLSTRREGDGFAAYIDLQSSNAQAIQSAFERADGGKDTN